MWGVDYGARSADGVGKPAADPDPDAASRASGRFRLRGSTPNWRLIATLLGLLSAACALAIPFLPVVQDTARIDWPHNGDTRPVNSPLTAYWAQEIDLTIPCATVKAADQATPGRTLLLSTVPPPKIDTGAGLHLYMDNNELTLISRGRQLFLPQPLPATGCDVTVNSTAERTTVRIGGAPLYDKPGDMRPRVIGIYSDLNGMDVPVDGLSVSITPDTRYQSSPTVWKTATTVLGILALLGCLIAINRMDAGVARRAPRWAPVGWWKLTARDVTVVGALGLWVFIGPVTSDDGYILSMARITDEAGYLTNYHRWFGVAEAPFGWFYHLTELMTHVSTVPPWIRLPSFVLGVIGWLLMSREILPRLGTQVRHSKAAAWAAASVYLVWWMPFNNGVRPEPVAAVGALLAIIAVERTLVTRRLLPLCLGLLAAAFTLAATPTGLIAVAPFLVAARPLFLLFQQRARAGGWWSVLAPIAASGLAVLVVVFADQTAATVVEATRLRNQVGPSLSWFQEFTRYDVLFGGGGSSGDDSLTRRFPVLLLILCTVTCLVVMLRRGRIPGASLGPSRRLIGTVALFFVLLALTPTKWTHHFGAFAAVGSAMAALTALATSTSVLRSARNRNAFLAALFLVAALAVTGPNSYWFVSKFGVPWSESTVGIGRVKLSSILVLCAVVAAIGAFVQNVRASSGNRKWRKPERQTRALMLSSAALSIVCGLFALSEFATVAKAAYNQRGSYSLASANIDHIFGGSCNLSDHVQVERAPVANVMKPYPPEQQVSAPAPPKEDEEAADAQDKERKQTKKQGKDKAKKLPKPRDDNGQSEEGFHTQPLDREDPLADPPHGFSEQGVPMWSSYQVPHGATGLLRTQWLRFTDKFRSRHLVVAVAGEESGGIRMTAEYAKSTPKGWETVYEAELPMPPGAKEDHWEDSRVLQDRVPAEATAVRLVVKDDDLTEDGWIAVATPRVPSHTTLTERVGDNPVYMDWPTAFVHPCVQMPRIHDGIAEVPAFRITANGLAYEADWAGSLGGGPIGWLDQVAEMPEVPSYLHGNQGQPWGQLLKVNPIERGVAPVVTQGQKVVPGWWSPGPGPMQPDGRNPTR